MFSQVKGLVYFNDPIDGATKNVVLYAKGLILYEFDINLFSFSKR